MADAIDRVKNIAFWQWEYTQRNPTYRRYSEAILALEDHIADHGIFELFKNSDFQKEADKFANIKAIYSYYHAVEGLLSDKATKELRRWKMLRDMFTERFMRRRRSSHLRANTCYEMILEMISEGRKREHNKDDFHKGHGYLSESLDDILALLSYHHDWSILVDERQPPQSRF